MVASLRASASSFDCSICFCFSGRVYCMASASPLASTTLDCASPSASLIFWRSWASASSSAILTCFCWISVWMLSWSSSCSFSSKPSRPLAYSSGNWMSASITSSTTMPSAASFLVMMPSALARTSSRLLEKISRTVYWGASSRHALATTGGTSSLSAGCGRRDCTLESLLGSSR